MIAKVEICGLSSGALGFNSAQGFVFAWGG